MGLYCKYIYSYTHTRTVTHETRNLSSPEGEYIYMHTSVKVSHKIVTELKFVMYTDTKYK